MIVAMKKATVIIRRQEKQEALHRLRKLGVLHLSAIPAQVMSAQEWREKKVLLEKVLALIAPLPAPATGTASERCDTAFKASGLEIALHTARSMLEKHEALRMLNEEQENLAKEMARLHDWQGVSVADLQAIADQGYEIRFFEVPPKQFALIPPEQNAFVVRRSKALLWVALVMKGAPFWIMSSSRCIHPGAAHPSWRDCWPATVPSGAGCTMNWTSSAVQQAKWSLPSMPQAVRSNWRKQRRPWGIPMRSPI